MGESGTVERERFFRPEKKIEGPGGEKYRKVLKKTIQVSSALLIISFLVFFSHQAYTQLLANPSFRVRDIQIRGCGKIARESLLSLASIEGMPNLFTVRVKDIGKRLESHPWIEGVGVRKVFPNRIMIEVQERKPIAIIQLEDLYYIDAKGVIFARVGDGDRYNYPIVTGLNREALDREPEETKQSITKAMELLLMAEKERVDPLEDISEIHLEKIFGIQCFTKAGGVRVDMGWDDFGEKLKRVSTVWADLQKRKISAVSIDCRDPNRVVVKKAPDKNGSKRR
jgi:cell division septal protein FtsQ